jgi:hypothetical protein
VAAHRPAIALFMNAGALPLCSRRTSRACWVQKQATSGAGGARVVHRLGGAGGGWHNPQVRSAREFRVTTRCGPKQSSTCSAPSAGGHDRQDIAHGAAHGHPNRCRPPRSHGTRPTSNPRSLTNLASGRKIATASHRPESVSIWSPKVEKPIPTRCLAPP